MSSAVAKVDVAVIGGGTIGLSAAYYAAAAGHQTVLFEQFDVGNSRASSDGDSRMFRVMYSDPTMARLAETSLGLWNEIEAFSGRTLLQRNGLLFYGLSEGSVEGDLALCAQTMRSLAVPYTPYATPQELKAAYSVFREVPEKYFGLSQPSSATIVVKRSLQTFRELAVQHGASLLTQCPASLRHAQPGGPYWIDTPRGTFAADHLILAPGAWSNQVLAAFGIRLNLKIWQMTVAYYGVNATLPWPMWYEFGPTIGSRQSLFYGFPPMERPGQIKVSADYTNDVYTDPQQCTYRPDPRLLDDMSAFLAQRFNGVDATARDPATCLYTMSPDYQIVLDTVPGFAGTAVITCESGRGFKYTPLFGRILVELATTGKSAYDISEFKIDRKGIGA
jgi:monomeric sarcosine oxidase